MLGFGRVDDAVFDALREHLSDEAILEFTYITMMYTMHAVISVALRLEYDDRADPIVEIAAPDDYTPENLGRQIGYGMDDEGDGVDRAAPAGPLDGRAGARARAASSPGPFAGQLLGDYGADVIKVESPGDGDPMRRWGVTRDGDSLWWPTIGRNKRSVTLDLRAGARPRSSSPASPRECDVVLENFRPGALDRWGLDYATLVGRATRALVLVHISGFGQTGPLAGQAGFGSVGEAMGGIRYTTGSPDRPPSRAGHQPRRRAGVGVRRDRHARRRWSPRATTGAGQEVDVAIYEAVAALMESTMADYELGGVVRTRSGSVLPGVAPSNVYPTSDGAEVVVAANADAVFARLCKAMGRPELADDAALRHPRRARRRTWRSSTSIVGAWTATLPCDELLAHPRRARRAGRPHLHRARHAHRPAVPRPRDGAAGSRRRRAGRCR